MLLPRLTRLCILFLPMLYSGLIFSAGDAGLGGKNRLGQDIYVGPMMSDVDVIAVTEPGSGKVNKEYLLADECPKWKRNVGEPQKEFTCLISGKSPLAGATYRFKILLKEDQCGDNIRAYVCVAGCQPKRVPRQIVLTPWEC